MEAFTDHEKLILCPYNEAHEIKVARMNVHLTKCRKNYPESVNRQCDFNSTHVVPEPELQYHHEYCPDRRKIELQIYEEEGTDVNKFPIVNKEVETEESWDNYNVPSYDPQKYCENKEIFRQIKVESAAKRRNFRVEERKRFNELAFESKKAERVMPETSKPLPNRVTGQTLDENDPESVQTLRKKLNLPRYPFIPQQQLSKD